MKIAFTGPQCSGKTEAVKVAQHYLKDTMVIKFAQPLYNILHLLGEEKNRGFMQDAASLIKKHYGRDKFIEIFDKRVKERPTTATALMMMPDVPYLHLLNDDARFIKETQYLIDTGWHVCFVAADRETRKIRADALQLDFLEKHDTETEATDLHKYCHRVIDNNGSLDHLITQVKEVIEICD